MEQPHVRMACFHRSSMVNGCVLFPWSLSFYAAFLCPRPLAVHTHTPYISPCIVGISYTACVSMSSRALASVPTLCLGVWQGLRTVLVFLCLSVW